MHCNKIVRYVYKDVEKNINLCQTEKLILSLAIYFARKNQVCYAKGRTIAFSLGISEKRVKNILTKLEKLKYIKRKRGYRRRYIYVHPDSEYFLNHNLQDKFNQNYTENKTTPRRLSTKNVNKAVDKNKSCGTLLPPYTFNNIYKTKNTNSQARLDSNSPPTVTYENIYCDKYGPLIKIMAIKRKIDINESNLHEINYHVNYNLSKNNPLKDVYFFINQALTLIMSGTWSKPRSMGFIDARRELKNEHEYIGSWDKQKEAEMSLERRNELTNACRYQV